MKDCETRLEICEALLKHVAECPHCKACRELALSYLDCLKPIADNIPEAKKHTK